MDISPDPFFSSPVGRCLLSGGYPSDLLHSTAQHQPIVRCGENRRFYDRRPCGGGKLKKFDAASKILLHAGEHSGTGSLAE